MGFLLRAVQRVSPARRVLHQRCWILSAARLGLWLAEFKLPATRFRQLPAPTLIDLIARATPTRRDDAATAVGATDAGVRLRPAPFRQVDSAFRRGNHHAVRIGKRNVDRVVVGDADGDGANGKAVILRIVETVGRVGDDR